MRANRSGKQFFLLVMSILLVVSLACRFSPALGPASRATQTGIQASGPSDTQTSPSQAGTAAHPMGAVARQGDIGMYVVSWKPVDGAQPLEQGQVYILADIIMINYGTEPYSLFPGDSLKVRDARGKFYSEVTFNCQPAVGVSCVVVAHPYGSSVFRRREAMRPNEPVRDQFVFSVPIPCPGCAFDLAVGNGNEHLSVALGNDPASVEVPADLTGAGNNTPGPGEIVTAGSLAFALLEWN
jgi:hypothetical protein